MSINIFDPFVFIPFLSGIFFIWHFSRGIFKKITLFASSIIFYGLWDPFYAILVIVVASITFYASIRIKHRIFYMIGLMAPLGLLLYFKYYYFFIYVLQGSGSRQDNLVFLSIVPVGMSFYTFQSLSYLIDLRREEISRANALDYFNYICFFPQLVAGPIEAYNKLGKQLSKTSTLNMRNLINGLKLILLGYTLKICCADVVGPIVDNVYQNIQLFEDAHPIALLAVIFFSFQIYADFFGYCLIAAGAARCFNIRLSANFITPYYSCSISEFWRRWHITLGSWFRKYILNHQIFKRNPSATAGFIAILTVFFISGVWHGAGLNFIFWGLAHGIIVCGERLLKKSLNIRGVAIENVKKIWRYLGPIYVFFIVTILWIPFRSESFTDFVFIAINIDFPSGTFYKNIEEIVSYCLTIGLEESLIFGTIGVLFIMSIELISRRKLLKIFLENGVKTTIFFGLCFTAIWFFYQKSHTNFIYFQF